MQSDARSQHKAETLAWASPKSGSASSIKRAAAQSPDLAQESLVAIPADNNALRFQLPAAAMAEQQPSPVGPSEVGSPGQTVVQASYAEAVADWSAEPKHGSRWQSPRIWRSLPTLPGGSVHAGWNGGGYSFPTLPMAPPEPGDFAMPRIRLPSQVAMQSLSGSSDGFRPRSSLR